MKKMPMYLQFRAAVVSMIILLILPALATGATLYVSAAGDDNTGSNDCTVQASPCKTISYAMSKITTDGTAGSPHVINVAAGTYNSGAVFTGEIYPINVTKKYISIVGADASTTEIVGTGGYTFSVMSTGTGFSVQNIKFSSAGTAVNINGGEGGHSFTDNIFTSSVSTGVYASIYPPAASTVTVNPVSFTGNSFASTNYGVDFKTGINFPATPGPHSGTIGAITATGNTFADTSTGFMLDGIYIDGSAQSGTATVDAINVSNNTFTNCSEGVRFDNLYVQNMTGGTVSFGAVTVDNNTFTENSQGIQIEGFFGSSGNNMVDTAVTAGNMSVSNNTISDSTSHGIDVDYYGLEYFSGTSSVVLGDFIVNNNTIEPDVNPAAGTGIRIKDIGYFQYITGSTTVTTGKVDITNNAVTSENNAIYLYNNGIQLIGIKGGTDTVVVNFGPLNVTGNTFSSTAADAAHLFISYIGYDQYAQTQVNTGLVTVDNNTITSTTAEALDLEYYYESGKQMDDDAMLSIAGLTVTNNTLSSTSGQGMYFYTYQLGYDITGNSTISVGPTVITGNTISSTNNYGFYLDSEDVGYTMNGASEITFDTTTFSNNTVTSTNDDGAYFYMYDHGYDMHGTSEISYGQTTISGNTITAYDEALYLYFYIVGYEMYDSSIFSMAPWTVSNNVLTATDSGDYAAFTIYYDAYEMGSYMNNNASATLPDWIISNNTIDAHGGYNGFYFYTYSSPDDNYDNASVHFGSMLIDNNTLNANKDNGMARGIDLWIEDVCEECYDSSSATFGDITITNNTIYNADDTAINFDYDDVGYAFDNDGTVTMGNVKIADNMVDTAEIGIKAFYNWPDSTINNTSAVTLGTLDITGNTITNIVNFGFNNGIVFDIRASIDAPTASLDIGKTVIADNTVTTSASATPAGAITGPPPPTNTSGIWINGDIGQDVVFAAPEVNNNTITEFTVGIGMDDLPEASMRCNTVQNNSEAGLFFLSDGNFTAEYNWLEDNVLGLKIDAGSTTTVKAEKNWWGDPLGPMACATCNTIDAGGGSVDYEPWLTSRPATCGGGFPWIMYTPAITGMKPAVQ